MWIKKIAISILVLYFINIFQLNAFAANFSDIKEDYWANSAIESLSQEKIISGYEDNTFRPNNPVTRAEFAVILIKALGKDSISIKNKKNFKDLKSSFWAYDYIQRACALGLIKGFPKGIFKPNAYITRTEAITILSNIGNTNDLSKDEAAQILSKFYDSNRIPDWGIIPLAKAANVNLIINYPQPNFLMPNKRATRADVTAMIYNLRNEIKSPQQ